MVNSRIRILLSAYACEPNKGSEPGVGWNWAVHLAQNNEVFVITRKNNKNVIEEYLGKNPIEHLHFYYHDCSGFMKKAKKLPNGIFIYYKKWQTEIFDLAFHIVVKEKIQIIHHITFNEFRTPGKLYKLNVPFVWGPIGGGQFYNSIFKPAYFKKSDLLKENTRNLINRCYLMASRDIHNVVRKASKILIADQSTERVMPKSRIYVRLLETAYNIDRNSIKSYDSIPVQGALNRPIRLLWVGGIWPRKGLKLLIDALGESDFRDFELSVIGSGQDKSSCESLVEKYEINEQVHFEGALSYEEVNKRYDYSDVFVFTSLRDTSGNVVLEAMSHGLPAITLNHHGAGEIVSDETGIRIDVSNYEQIKREIIKAIRTYAKKPQKIISQGTAARKRIEKVYSWAHSIEVMEQIYKGIIEAGENDDKRE